MLSNHFGGRRQKTLAIGAVDCRHLATCSTAQLAPQKRCEINRVRDSDLSHSMFAPSGTSLRIQFVLRAFVPPHHCEARWHHIFHGSRQSRRRDHIPRRDDTFWEHSAHADVHTHFHILAFEAALPAAWWGPGQTGQTRHTYNRWMDAPTGKESENQSGRELNISMLRNKAAD